MLKKIKHSIACVFFGLLATSQANALSMWHSDTVWAGQGMCVASFTFDSGLEPVQQLKVHAKAVDKSNALVEEIVFEVDAFGAASVDRYANDFWESENACDSDLKVVVTFAEAIINNQRQDLLATNQLNARDFTPFVIEFSPRQAPTTQPANACNNPKFTATALIQDKDGYTNVRSQPNAQSTVIEKVFDNEPFYTFTQKGNWWQVCTPAGKIGYMYHNRIVLQ